MEERNDAFDSAIRERLSGHEPAVPHALWTRISAELNESEEAAAPAAPKIQAPVATTPWWRVAAAAAVVLTVGAASLLFAYQPAAENTVATTTGPAVNNTPAAPAIQVQDAHQVAVAATPAVAKTIAPAPIKEQPATSNTVVADNSDNTIKDIAAPATTPDNNAELAAAPATTPASTIDLGSVPAFSLKRLSAPESLNDEITIIKSAPSKKKHGRHSADEETTRVIILNKKFDSQPGIRYQLPVRF